jgi:hypothetical protein
MQNSPQLIEIVDDLPKIAGRVYHIELCELPATGRLIRPLIRVARNGSGS